MHFQLVSGDDLALILECSTVTRRISERLDVNRRPKLTPCRRPKLTPCSMAADAPTQLVGIAQSGRPRIGRAMIAVR